MKAYALSALSIAAAAVLAIATPMPSSAAGFGAAAGFGNTLSPSVSQAGACTSSIDVDRKIWLACGEATGGHGPKPSDPPSGGLRSAPMPSS